MKYYLFTDKCNKAIHSQMNAIKLTFSDHKFVGKSVKHNHPQLKTYTNGTFTFSKFTSSALQDFQMFFSLIENGQK